MPSAFQYLTFSVLGMGSSSCDLQNVLTTGRRRGLQVNPNQFSLEQEISMIQAAQEQQAARDAAAASSSSSSVCL